MINYIYKITNKINNKIYIGMTSNIENRWKTHLHNSKLYKEGKKFHRSHLYEAMKKYGTENFVIELIEECPREIAGKREEYWIKTLNSQNNEIGYNICKGGTRGPGGALFKGHHHSNETKQKMRESRVGKNNSNYGNRWHQSEELKQLHSKLSSGENNGMYGKKQSNESKNKIRMSLIGRKRMSNSDIFPKYKNVKSEEISKYEENGWFVIKK